MKARFLSTVTSYRSGRYARTPLFVAALLSLSLSARTQGPASTGRTDAIASYLQPLIDNHTIAGAVTLVADKDRVVYLEPVGYQDLADKDAMPVNAMFWIASTSKPMTVTAFMMLVDEGKVSLDDPVEKYLPEFHGQKVKGANNSSGLVAAKHPILVREILSHTSGLPFKSAA